MANDLRVFLDELLAEEPNPTGTLLIEALRRYLGANPEGIGEILPEWRLVKRRSPTVDAVRKRVDAANTQRTTAAQERYREIEPILRKAVGENPAITLRELAKLLDEQGPAPARAAAWSAAQVKYMMERLEIGYDGTE